MTTTRPVADLGDSSDRLRVQDGLMISEYFFRNVEGLELMQQEVDLLENTRKVGPLIQDRVYVDSNILLDS